MILFTRNLQEPSQAAHLVNALQKLAPAMPLFVAIDQEGGRVARLPKGFTVFPGQGALGRAGTVELAYSFAEVTAKELRAIGVNMNLTPVLDINSNPGNPIIGDRAFGNDPLQVETLGLAVIAGLQDNGVLACGKHFPGHGDTTADSHLTPIVRMARALRELIASLRGTFSKWVARLSRTSNTLPDPEFPATLSPAIMTDCFARTSLKGWLDGDLEMQPLLPLHYRRGATARQAGADISSFASTRTASSRMDAVNQG